MMNIALINVNNKQVIKIVTVKDESVASEVITATRQAVAGINPNLEVAIHMDDALKRNEAIAEIMRCAVEYSIPMSR